MIDININELRRLTQAATPGPWHFWRGWVAADIDSDGGIIITERPKLSGGKYQARVDGNFRFIAATNPAVISELLDRLEAAEKERDELLNALETLSKMAEAFPSELHEKHPDVVAARAAITKATGDQI